MGVGPVSETVAYLGLGTNMGDREGNLRAALRLLSADEGILVRQWSQVYETEPWGVTDQPKFLNFAVEAATTLTPDALLTLCKEVEATLGRVPGPRFGPRLIDLDILLYGREVVELPHLQIPHPRLHLRAFALVPMEEIAPDAHHPLLGLSISRIALGAEGRESVIPNGRLELSLGGADC